MPAEKYDFVPTAGEFKGVRTFAEQLKHIAADNYLLGAGVLGENPRGDVNDGERGSASMKTKPWQVAPELHIVLGEVGTCVSRCWNRPRFASQLPAQLSGVAG